jgi:hypothetical protein
MAFPADDAGRETLEASLRSLAGRVDVLADAAKRRQWITGLVLGGLLLGTAGYLGWLYRTVTEFADPEVIVELASAQIEPRIDEQVDSVGEQLRAQAPALLDQAEKIVLDAPPQVSLEAQRYLGSQLDTHIKTLEEQTYDLVSGMLKESLARAKAEGIDLNDDDQVDKLVAEAAPLAREEFRRVIRKVHGEYAEGADNIASYLDRLTSGAPLSVLEERQRDVLITGLSLIEKLESDPSRAPIRGLLEGRMPTEP